MQTVVDVSRLRHNIRIIRSTTRTGFCAVVKADAYGHGAAVAGFISPLVDCFLVATLKEAEEILPLTDKPILVLGGDISQFTRTVDRRIIPTVSDVKQLSAILNIGHANYSVAVNTGMNRLGARDRSLENILSLCKQNDSKPWSVYSHLYGGIYSAGYQAAEFERLTADPVLRGRRHLYCSCALDFMGCELYDMTRCGLAMYGYSDCTDICMRVRAKIVGLNRVGAGEHVGYGDYTLENDSLVATVRMGYADGLRRTDKPLYFTVRGKKCRVIGVPCMDLCMIDVTGLDCRCGEFAYLISEKSDTEYLAKCYDTIVYEVLTGFKRGERIYI